MLPCLGESHLIEGQNPHFVSTCGGATGFSKLNIQPVEGAQAMILHFKNMLVNSFFFVCFLYWQNTAMILI